MEIFYFHLCCWSQHSTYGLSNKFYQLLLKYFNVVFCNLKRILILWMWNVKFNLKTFFYILFIQTKISEETKHNKTDVKIHESL